MNRGFILHEDLTYTMLHEMVIKKFNLEAMYPLNLSAKVSSIDDNFDITDDHEEDRGCQLAILNLGHQYGEEIKAKNELLKADEQCRDISMDKHAKIEKFLKIESKLDYEMQSALFRKVAKLEKQIRDKLDHEIVQSNYVCVVPDAYAFRLQPQVPLSFQEALDLAIRLKALDEGYQFLNDRSAPERHVAIALAVQDEFPLAYHVVCCRHLMMNLSLKRDKTKALSLEMKATSVKVSRDLSSKGARVVLSTSQTHRFTSPPRRSFVGELVATIDPIELERFLTNQVKRILAYSLGYDENSTTFLYLRKPNCSLDSGLVPLADALQDHNMLLMFTNQKVEINNLMVLQDHPLVDYGKYALGCMTGADMKKCVHLKSVRGELLRSMEEKRQLMANYRDV
nr:transposase, MuDR, MULE transposase domain protein [Tanacetum cinerariifolium]